MYMLFEDVVSKVEVDTEKLSYEKELGIVDIQSIRFQESFSKNIKVSKVYPVENNKCMLHYEEDGNMRKVFVNKQSNYFEGYIGKEVLICGTSCKKNKKIQWYILCCYEISGEEEEIAVIEGISEEEKRAFEKKVKKLVPEVRRDLSNKVAALSSIPKATDDELPAIYRSIEEMNILYDVLKPAIFPEYQAEYESCLRALEQKPGNTEKQNFIKVMRNILAIDWVNQISKPIDVDKAIEHIKEEHLGHEAQIESIRTEMIASNLNGKGPATINFVGRSGGGSLALAIANALGRPYAEIDLSGDSGHDSDKLLGSSRIYENGRQGLLWEKLSKAGPYGVLVFKHIDQYDKRVIELIKRIISKDGFEDGFMQLNMDLSHMWIFCTCSSIKDLPISVRKCTNEIFLPDLSESTILQIINQRFLPKYCNEYKLQCHSNITENVAKKLIYQMSNKDLHRLENTIRSIVIRVVASGKKSFPKLTESNIEKYCFNKGDYNEVKKEYVTESTAMEHKFFTCYDDYNDEIKSRELELLDTIHYSTNEEDKKYATSASKYLVNLFKGDSPVYKAGAVLTEIKKTHYGHERYAELLEDAILSHELSKGKNGMTVIGIYGGPGTGKTSSAEGIAKAMGRDFLKISLGGINDPRVFKGTSRVYVNAEPSIIVRELAKEGKSLSTVILFDEPDKMEQSHAGNPYDPLHELLDPNQAYYYDEYLECNIPKNDLVILLAFNDISKIPDTILDRMKVIKCESYSSYDKKQIVKNYVACKIAKTYGLERINISDEALDLLVDEYSISLGVRDCEKDLDRIVVRKARENGGKFTHDSVEIGVDDVRIALGSNRLRGLNDIPKGEKILPGQAQALAVSGNYGSCFAIQTMINEYQDEPVIVTGLPEGSCRESITDAMFLASQYLKKKLPNLYIHMTDSGVKKDGPSAGLTLFCSIMSCMLKKPLPNVAFTGTIDVLYSTVGIIGGVEEKITAAERKGIEKVYIPLENYEELQEKGKIDRFKPEIVPVRNLSEVLKELFDFET